jgi:Carboxypeptidase regulatory-like domain
LSSVQVLALPLHCVECQQFPKGREVQRLLLQAHIQHRGAGDVGPSLRVRHGTGDERLLDAQGAVVPNASVTATEPTKNVTVTTKTNDQGDFVFPGLQPGTYNITIEAAGFKKLERPNIPLDANDKLALGNLGLQVGAVSEAVEVTAQAALLQTESVERSATMHSKQMENIEVNGRSPLDMVKLIPGVVSTENVSVGGVGGLSGLFINGNRGTEISSPSTASATLILAPMAART